MINIREAKQSDATPIANLTGELGYEATADIISQRLARLLARSDQRVYVALFEGKVAGWIQAHASEILETGLRVEIVGLVVSSDFRRRGLGRELVRHIETWSGSIGAGTVVVRSNLTRQESHVFYRALGYECVKTQAVFRKRLP